jgi:hypothetical protein
MASSNTSTTQPNGTLPVASSNLAVPSASTSASLLRTVPMTLSQSSGLPLQPYVPSIGGLENDNNVMLPTIYEPPLSPLMEEPHQLLVIREGQPDVVVTTPVALPLSPPLPDADVIPILTAITASGASADNGVDAPSHSSNLSIVLTSSTSPPISPPSPTTMNVLASGTISAMNTSMARNHSDFRSPPLETPIPTPGGTGMTSHHSHRFSRSVLPPLSRIASMSTMHVPPSSSPQSGATTSLNRSPLIQPLVPRFHDDNGIVMQPLINMNGSNTHIPSSPNVITFVHTQSNSDIASTNAAIPSMPAPTVSPGGVIIRSFSLIDPTYNTRTAAAAASTAITSAAAGSSAPTSTGTGVTTSGGVSPSVSMNGNLTKIPSDNDIQRSYSSTSNVAAGDTLPRSVLPRVESATYITAMNMAATSNNNNTNDILPIRRHRSAAEMKYLDPQSIMEDDIANGDERTVTHVSSATGAAAMASHQAELKQFYPTGDDDDDDDDDHQHDDGMDNVENGESDGLLRHHGDDDKRHHGVDRVLSGRTSFIDGVVGRAATAAIADMPVALRGPNWVAEIEYVAALRPATTLSSSTSSRPRTPQIMVGGNNNSVPRVASSHNVLVHSVRTGAPTLSRPSSIVTPLPAGGNSGPSSRVAAGATLTSTTTTGNGRAPPPVLRSVSQHTPTTPKSMMIA